MKTVRDVVEVFRGQPTLEGAGVRLTRVFGYSEVPRFDPFLMLDHFKSCDPADYRAGFPWHPHRGIETVSYVLQGGVEHGDSMNNSGTVGPGDVQWMTAGRGIIHQEMPCGDEAGALHGFQLWVNLPASHKMMPPRYQEIPRAHIPEVHGDGDVLVRVIAGHYKGAEGPVRDIVMAPGFLDVTLPADKVFEHELEEEHTVFAFVIEGVCHFGPKPSRPVAAGHAVLFGAGDGVVAVPGIGGGRFLLISGKPIGEPVAWAGPIVMNSQSELDTAFQELDNGTFLGS